MPAYLESECGYRISIGRHGDALSYLAAWQDKDIVGAVTAVPKSDDNAKRDAIASLQALCEEHEATRLRGDPPPISGRR